MGMDVFMDVGIVSVETVSAAMQQQKDHPEESLQVDFSVSHRFGMSLASAMMIHQRLTQFIEQSVARVNQDIEQQQKQSAPANKSSRGNK